MRHKPPLNRPINKNDNAALPVHPVAAIQRLIRISQSLMMLAEKETQALLVNDMLAFAIMQYEKEKLSGDYLRASECFRNRLEEFRNADPNLLNRLEKLQRELSEKMNGNNAIVERIRERTNATTQKNALTAQNMGHDKRVRFKKNTTDYTATGLTEGVQT